MKFRTVLKGAASPIQINHHSKVLFMGSCFAENIGKAMVDRKFTTLINPLGISYNPISIAKNIAAIAECKTIIPADIHSKNGSFFHYDYHGSNNTSTAISYADQINESLKSAHDFLQSTDYLFVSLGTSHVFSHEEKGVVNNCHKMPNDLFTRRLLKMEEIVSALQRIKTLVSKVNNRIKIVFTVSPIRHVRDGLVADRRSKSMLIAALTEVIDDKDIFYFPSYELLIDDLRDYRFYKEDLIHPSDQAISYIWEYFSSCYFSENTLSTLQKVEKILAMQQHKILNPSSEEAEAFKTKIKEHISAISDSIPSDRWV